MPRIKHRGLHTHRFKDNPEEKRFAEAWEKMNKEGHTLAYLLDPQNGVGRLRPLEISQGEATAAATVIQWLGSPVGQIWLSDLGYVKRSK